MDSYFSNAVTTSSHSLVVSAHMITKVYFPRSIVPVAAVVRLTDFLVASAILVVLMIYYGQPITWTIHYSFLISSSYFTGSGTESLVLRPKCEVSRCRNSIASRYATVDVCVAHYLSCNLRRSGMEVDIRVQSVERIVGAFRSALFGTAWTNGVF